MKRQGRDPYVSDVQGVAVQSKMEQNLWSSDNNDNFQQSAPKRYSFWLDHLSICEQKFICMEAVIPRPCFITHLIPNTKYFQSIFILLTYSRNIQRNRTNYLPVLGQMV